MSFLSLLSLPSFADPAPKKLPPSPSAQTAPLTLFEGFNTIHWGDSANLHTDLLGFYSAGELNVYVRKNDTKKLGPVDLFQVAYAFDKNFDFIYVMLVVEHKNIPALKEELTKRLGKPARSADDGRIIDWQAEGPKPEQTIVAAYEKKTDPPYAFVNIAPFKNLGKIPPAEIQQPTALALPDTAQPNVYVTKGGNTYHTATCKRRSPKATAIPLNSAIELGYTPCKTCKP